jgi:signal transduction histidine kinase
MNLQTKILLTLLLVIAIGLTTASLITNRTATRAYESYLNSNFRQQLHTVADQAAARYAESHSWPAVQDWLDTLSPAGRGPGMMGSGDHAGGGMGMMRQMYGRAWLLVAPNSGQPLAGDAEPVTGEELAGGVPLTVDGQVVALLVVPNPMAMMMGPSEQRVIDQVNRATLIAALTAGIAALFIGGILVNNLLRPLRTLEAAMTQVGQGNFDVQVVVGNRDEIGQLAAGFNQMSANLHRQEALRQRMVTDIAHELRTPLSVVQGNLQAILDGVYPLAMPEIQTLADEIGLLARLVNDLHEVALAEAKRLPLILQAMPIADVLQHMAERFRSLAETQSITLKVEVPTTPLHVQADSDRLQQIFHNLLGNALRHTPRGGTIGLSAESTSDNLIRFRVQDTGVGIPPADLPYIFERFYRGDKNRARGNDYTSSYTTGSGLGLAIVKSLIAAHGGRVGVESSEGVGSTFWFELPRDPRK